MFVPLRVISGYSFLQSGLTIEKIVQALNKEKFIGAGLADSSFLYGVPSFIEEMEKNKKKYLIGMEMNIDNNFLVAYILNEEGYRNLIHLSLLMSTNQIKLTDLKEHHSGLVFILETNYGKFKEEFSKNYPNEFVRYFAKISEYVNDLLLGIEVTNKAEFAFAKDVRYFAEEYAYNTIAFPRIKYSKKEDAIILKIVEAIDKDEKIEEKEENGEYYFHNIEYYSKLYTKNELNLTEELLNKSTFNFHLKRGNIIHYPVSDPALSLKENVFKGLKEKGIDDQKHIDRANLELEVITSMGYADYFLIVSDYVNYARSHDILVGPGRGSAAGSLVSYAIGITEVDPLKYDLQFERFLNKARKTMPDIDVDFMDTERDRVVDYLREKYGNDKVANIATFQTIQAKQALRDIGRIYNIPTRHIDLLSKSITDKMSLRDAYKKLPTFKNLVDSDKYFLNIVSLASKIEGLPRQAGMHAAGVILNIDPIEEVLPVTVDLEDHYTSQYEKDYLEAQGFLKMDFLSLRNLTTIDYCLSLIKKNKGKEISFYDIPYEEKEIFDLIRSGQTIGLFQIESSGMRNAIKILQPKKFEDIVTLLAIFRPGPMDNIKDYVNRKNGKIKVSYLSKELEEILSPTYGVIIYQEQINKIAQVMAGFSPTEADLFRRAISKKDKEILASSKTNFTTGAIKKGYSKKDSEEMFAQILKFADYGFNKSHAVVYSIIACRMAYLKYYYPLEFYSAILTISSGTTDHKFSDYVREIVSRNYKVYLPNINKSNKNFVVNENGLLFPLSNIRGVNDIVVNKIINERIESGEYKDYFDFVSRMYKIGISDNVISKLIDSGALDVLHPSRATLRATLRYAYQLAELSYDKNGQIILDATLENQKQFFNDIDIPLVNLNLEYEELGIMLSDNPLRYKKDLLEMHHVVPLIDAKENRRRVTVCGIISSIKTIKVKKNNTTMAFIKIFDESDEMEVTIFPKTFEESFTLLEKNNIVLIEGRYELSKDREGFIADKVSLLEE